MSRIHDLPFDPAGSHALEKARERATGPGLWVGSRRWCFACDQTVKVGGGRMVGRLWKCAGCVASSKTITPGETTE